MTVGLLAPLSPQEEIALRRIALGSLVIDAQAAAKLIAIALLQQTGSGLRLTPLGRLRFNALPKAPLLTPGRSIRAMTGFVEGLIEKAQSRAAAQRSPSDAPPPAPGPSPMRAPTGLRPEPAGEDVESDELPVYFDCGHWKSCAERALARARRSIMEHRRRQVRLCDASDRRIASSRALLKESVPIRSDYFDAAK
jgi:hypothetical protein